MGGNKPGAMTTATNSKTEQHLAEGDSRIRLAGSESTAADEVYFQGFTDNADVIPDDFTGTLPEMADIMSMTRQKAQERNGGQKGSSKNGTTLMVQA